MKIGISRAVLADRRNAPLVIEREKALSDQCVDAQTRIAVLEATIAETEHRADALSRTLNERTALLIEAHAGINLLETVVADTDYRAVQLAHTLTERSAELTRTRAHIAALENQHAAELGRTRQHIAALENKHAAELGRARQHIAALDIKHAAELGRTREHIAALNRDLVLYMQWIAAIKASWSWRLMAPFREMYRPLRRLRNSRFGNKLRAVWRHPTNAAKRKAYRASQNAETGRPKCLAAQLQ